MYYEESSQLIEHMPLDKTLIHRLDREIAHVYSPSGRAHVEESLLIHKVAEPASSVRPLLERYKTLGVLDPYSPLACPCGEMYHPEEMECPQCGRPLDEASDTTDLRYVVLKRPAEPSYDPLQQPATPDIFISYRRPDCWQLAADIYFRFRAEGCSVFLDKGEIPPGADPRKTFLCAASAAGTFFMLVSEHYFESPYCKQEIAHSLRAGCRPVRVNVPPLPPLPSDMPWLDGPNWASQSGRRDGLTPALEKALLDAAKVPASVAPMDLRLEACQYLMEQLSPTQITELWNRLPWMREIEQPGSKPKAIMAVRQEITLDRLPVLCASLAP